MAKYPKTGVIYNGLATFDAGSRVVAISALGALFAGAGYDLRNFDRLTATDTLFNGYRAWVSGLQRELPLTEAIEDLMRHESWTPEDVARYLERNLGL